MIASSLVCLALTLWTESRGEPIQGQIAVASVVMNRVEQNNSSVCKEINKPYQFPWAKEKFRKVKNDYYVQEKAVPKGEPWEKSLALASAILDGSKAILPKITSFHNNKEFPKWKLRKEYVLGNHIFYSNGILLAKKESHITSKIASATTLEQLIEAIDRSEQGI